MKQLSIFEDEISPDLDLLENKDKNDIKNHKEIVNKNFLNEIVDIKYKNETYKIWTVEYIKPLITKFLKEKYTNSIIIYEFDNIDIVVLDNEMNCQIPIEIQKSIFTKNKFASSGFEDRIRRQIELNIKDYKICHLFLDSEYLRYLQSENTGTKISVDLTWLISLMKENTLKVFTIKYDGFAKELITKDFDFLKNISQTCKIGYDNDERILNRNKLKIHRNVIKGYNFTQDEIDKFHRDFNERCNEERESALFFMKSDDKRCKLYGYLKRHLNNLSNISNCLDMKNDDRNTKYSLNFIGIIETLENSRKSQIKFVDKFDICKYFPGYVRREKLWLIYKNQEMSNDMFNQLCIGRFLNHKTIFEY